MVLNRRKLDQQEIETAGQQTYAKDHREQVIYNPPTSKRRKFKDVEVVQKYNPAPKRNRIFFLVC